MILRGDLAPRLPAALEGPVERQGESLSLGCFGLLSLTETPGGGAAGRGGGCPGGLEGAAPRQEANDLISRAQTCVSISGLICSSLYNCLSHSPRSSH